MEISIKPGTLKATGAKCLIVRTPYHPAFPPAARDLGGKWVQAQSLWTFDPRDEQRVRDLCMRLFGTDGSAPVETCTATVRVSGEGDGGAACRLGARNPLWLCGRLVVERRERDAGVRLGDGVILAAGAFPRTAGSARYPALFNVGGEATLELRDVPTSLALAAVETYAGAVSIGSADAVLGAEQHTEKE